MRRVIKALAYVGCGIVLSASVNGQTSGAGRQTAAATPALSDTGYVAMMVVHHGDGIKMAELAAKKAPNQQVRQLATRILTAQQTELKELHGLHATLPAEAGVDHSSMMKKMPMEHLEQSSGVAFDRMFLEMMTEHHQEAIKMSRGANLKVAAVQAFSRKTIAQQEKDVKEMQALRKKLGQP